MRGRYRVLIVIGCVVAVAIVAVAVESWRSSQQAGALPKASCGSATTHRADNHTVIITADPGALTCFDAAAHSCRPASIQLVEMGVDAGTTYVFRIEHGSATCLVTELSQGYSANFGGHTGQVDTATCHMTVATGTGVTLACSGGDVLIPAFIIENTKADA